LVAVALITLLAASLRFATLGVQSVGLDESLTMLHVNTSFGAMLSHVARSENTPPLYFVLVWAWTHVFGHSVFAFRSFSAVLGSLTVPLLYRFVAVRRTTAYATYRFLAPHAVPVTVGWLRRAFGDRHADIVVQG
jgi:uncharacterized membrane protein